MTEADRDPPSVAWRSVRLIVAIWAIWATSLLAFQEIVVARLEPERPDFVLSWTDQETGLRRHGGRPYLSEPLFNTHIAFDSEYYLSIAVVGYDDTEVPQYTPPRGPMVPLNYAFMPAYPFAMRIVAAPAAALGMEPVTAAAFAGIAVSLVAALGAMLALHRLARPQLGEDGGGPCRVLSPHLPDRVLPRPGVQRGVLPGRRVRRPRVPGRSPSAAGRAAGDRRRPDAAGRARARLRDRRRPRARSSCDRGAEIRARRRRSEWASWAFALIGPVVAYAVWATSAMGQAFEVVQREYFGRGLLNLDTAWRGWTNALSGFADALPQTQVYYGLEVVAVIGAVIACAWAFRRWPAASAFGLADVGGLTGQRRAPGNGAVRPRRAADLPRPVAAWRRILPSTAVGRSPA